MPKIEKVIAFVDGQFTEREISVMRRVIVTCDCHCWNHRPVQFEIIVPGGAKEYERGAAYVRSVLSEHFFRLSDRNGPIDIRVDEVKQE